MKCERCGEREAEVLRDQLVRTAEGEELRRSQLCAHCGNVGPGMPAFTDLLQRLHGQSPGDGTES
jgi:protein-arginine kinase activator protein McsA